MTNPFEASNTSRTATTPAAHAMTTIELLFSFEGRITRSQYWLATIGTTTVFCGGLIAVGVPLGVLLKALPNDESAVQIVVFGLGAIGLIPFIWTSLAIQAKRWHDRNKSGFWILIGVVPYIGGIWSFIECGCLRGTIGVNEYGADPLDPSSPQKHRPTE